MRKTSNLSAKKQTSVEFFELLELITLDLIYFYELEGKTLVPKKEPENHPPIWVDPLVKHQLEPIQKNCNEPEKSANGSSGTTQERDPKFGTNRQKLLRSLKIIFNQEKAIQSFEKKLGPVRTSSRLEKALETCLGAYLLISDSKQLSTLRIYLEKEIWKENLEKRYLDLKSTPNESMAESLACLKKTKRPKADQIINHYLKNLDRIIRDLELPLQLSKTIKNSQSPGEWRDAFKIEIFNKRLKLKSRSAEKNKHVIENYLRIIRAYSSKKQLP